MKRLKLILGWLVTLLVPVILVLAAVRILLSTFYINIEYRMPYFPEDRYGFSQADRLYWAELSRAYLLNDAGIEFLADLRFPEGQLAAGDCAEFLPPRDCGYFYNDRELKHMEDVKIVVGAANEIRFWASLAVVGLWFWASRTDWWQIYRQALWRGGMLTLGLIAMILVYLALNFNSLFILFHRIFFAGDSWLFQFSDSLIRLFPVEFWRDAFIWVGLLSAAGGALLVYFFRGPAGLTRAQRLKSQHQKPVRKAGSSKQKRRR